MAYNSAHTGPEIDAAISAVKQKESVWDEKQAKLTGAEEQLVGFDGEGNAVAVDQGIVPVMRGGTGAGTAAEALSNLGAVPEARKINGYELSNDVTLSPIDIGAASESVVAGLESALEKKANLSQLVNPNLLENWYLANPVNTGGLVRFDANQDNRVFDGWTISTANTVVEILDGYTAVSRKPGSSSWPTLTQSINWQLDALRGRTVTAACLTRQNELYWDVYTVPKEGAFEIGRAHV